MTVVKGSLPDFNIRARTEPGNDASFKTIGVAWKVKVRGEDGFSVKLHSIPINWDGSCLMQIPKKDEPEKAG